MIKLLDKDLLELYRTITTAIDQGVKDLHILDGESYQTDYVIRMVNECWGLYHPKRPVCYINRRRAICNIYADYCDDMCFPYVKGEKRVQLFMNAINNHFNDIA